MNDYKDYISWIFLIITFVLACIMLFIGIDNVNSTIALKLFNILILSYFVCLILNINLCLISLGLNILLCPIIVIGSKLLIGSL